MDSKNLAKIWWPTILRPEFPSFETMAQSSQYLEQIILMLIDNHEFFFDLDDDDYYS